MRQNNTTVIKLEYIMMLCAFLNNIFKLSILFKILAPSNGIAGIRLNAPSAVDTFTFIIS